MVLCADLSTDVGVTCWKRRIQEENDTLRRSLLEECGRTGERLLPPGDLFPEEGGLPRPAPPKRFLRQGTAQISTPPHRGYWPGPPGESCQVKTGSLPSMMGFARGSPMNLSVGGAADHHTTQWVPPSTGSSLSTSVSMSGCGAGTHNARSRGTRARSTSSLSGVAFGEGDGMDGVDMSPSGTPATRSSRRASSRGTLSTVASSVLKRKVKEAVERELAHVLQSGPSTQ
eukprot:TRINITY_DN48364_c0_g1_i1.p1 TRINITY_DN48364_c0_g1~~TRINITY_DN48364_c0_g1_i1.p1  ORF type:complete len:229 (+),score=23.95 TRINITY_DN48364_c0_g1_i1:118-804(+)